jgi:hypothetical protein
LFRIYARSQIPKVANVVIRDQDADAAVAQLPDDVLDVEHGERIDAANGSSSNMNTGENERHDLQAPLPPEGNARGFTKVRDRQLVEKPGQAFSRSTAPVRVSRIAKMFCSTVSLRNTDASWEVADSGRALTMGSSVKSGRQEHAAFVGARGLTTYKGRGLGSVRTEQAHDFAAASSMVTFLTTVRPA